MLKCIVSAFHLWSNRKKQPLVSKKDRFLLQKLLPIAQFRVKIGGTLNWFSRTLWMLLANLYVAINKANCDDLVVENGLPFH